jgi:hypothetical protein
VNPAAEDRREVNGDEGREHYRQMAVANWNCRMNERGHARAQTERE